MIREHERQSEHYIDQFVPIPRGELQTLALILADAAEKADAGKPALGYAMLIRGLEHAESAALAGEPWACALMERWRETIDQYCRHYVSEEAEEGDVTNCRRLG